MISKNYEEPQLYSIRAAAKILGIGRTTTWKLITAGTLDAVQIGGLRMVRAESLQKLIAEGTPAPTPQSRPRAVRSGRG